ncbi:MAG TPA: sigma-70 family RNA polymerase sigma factor, partial [Roseiflexaceae bacterium]|nr:sigma-70 family RNA polymerase sigma factor [Roseiflexaceae bacterium]
NEHAWSLSREELSGYIRYLLGSCPTLAGMSDVQIALALRYYHKDHAMVEALRDAANPQHAENWMAWTRQAMHILIARAGGLHGFRDDTMSLEDVVQEAVCDLWRGLGQFNYQSSFQTWAFRVISNCLARQYRFQQTQKRRTLAPPESLDTLLADGVSLHDRSTLAPDAVAFSHVLAGMVDRILAAQADRRLAMVFSLAVYDEQTLRMIGDQLHLSVARVHALLKQAQELLQADRALGDWNHEALVAVQQEESATTLVCHTFDKASAQLTAGE